MVINFILFFLSIINLITHVLLAKDE
jgi:hypothetical protein